MLATLTCTGLDARTSTRRAAALQARYLRLEYGVLMGTHTPGPGLRADPAHPRLPPLDRIRHWSELGAKGELRVALHLCGRPARAVRTHDHDRQGGPLEDTVERIRRLAAGCTRIQVNLPGAPSRRERRNLETFAASLPAHQRLIVQHHGPGWPEKPLRHAKVDVLHDPSGGRGRDARTDWPAPPENAVPGHPDQPRIGYAGGIDRGNIRQAAAFARRVDAPVWLDVETGARIDDRFSLSVVAILCARAFGRTTARDDAPARPRYAAISPGVTPPLRHRPRL